MTPHEKLNVGISTAALAISIVSPLLNYYFFQNAVRVQQLKRDAFAVHAYAYGCPDKHNIIFQIWVENKGLWPINHVSVTILKTLNTYNFNLTDNRRFMKFTLDKTNIIPPLPLKVAIEEKSNVIVVQFKDALPPNTDLKLAELDVPNVPPGHLLVQPDLESQLPSVRASSEVSSLEMYWGTMRDCPTSEQLNTAP